MQCKILEIFFLQFIFFPLGVVPVFHFKRFTWALRKLRLPVDKNSIVLDVGSGGNPHPRSDILLDRITGAEHRSGVAMKIDRMAVIGDATKLPFKDKSIDFIIASHVLEHMAQPEVFLKELQRVGKAGYIETPNFICERLIPCEAHCLEISVVEDALQIYKKKKSVEDSYMGQMGFLQKNSKWKELYHNDPELFHVKYFWNSKINYKIHNPETSCFWIDEIYKNSKSDMVSTNEVEERKGWRYLGLTLLNFFQKHRRSNRLKNFNLFSILACPECRGELVDNHGYLTCNKCSIKYSSSPFLNFDQKIE